MVGRNSDDEEFVLGELVDFRNIRKNQHVWNADGSRVPLGTIRNKLHTWKTCGSFLQNEKDNQNISSPSSIPNPLSSDEESFYSIAPLSPTVESYDESVYDSLALSKQGKSMEEENILCPFCSNRMKFQERILSKFWENAVTTLKVPPFCLKCASYIVDESSNDGEIQSQLQNLADWMEQSEESNEDNGYSEPLKGSIIVVDDNCKSDNCNNRIEKEDVDIPNITSDSSTELLSPPNQDYCWVERKRKNRFTNNIDHEGIISKFGYRSSKKHFLTLNETNNPTKVVASENWVPTNRCMSSESIRLEKEEEGLPEKIYKLKHQHNLNGTFEIRKTTNTNDTDHANIDIKECDILNKYNSRHELTEMISSKEEKDLIQTNHNFKESQDDNITAATQIERVNLQKNQERTLTNEPTNIVESMQMKAVGLKVEEEKMLTDYSNHFRMTEIINSKEEKDFIDTSHSFKESRDDNDTAATQIKRACLQKNQ